jgi:DNA/RNA-binding domain of Phe-tRNA-synthetase-like protein
MRCSVDERLFHLFPFLRIGILVCDINNTLYGEDKLEAIVESTRGHFRYEKAEDHPHIRAWHEAFERVGIPVSTYQSSVETFLKRALRGGPFPRISPVVDLYNAVSLKHIVPMRGHDIACLSGDVYLTFAEGTEVFVPIDTGEQEIVDKGEVVYRDDRGVLTRRWVWRQSNNDKVVAETTSVLITADVMDGLPEGLCDEVLNEMERGLLQNGIGRVLHRDILAIDNNGTEFNTWSTEPL